jgi:hypothetical protein
MQVVPRIVFSRGGKLKGKPTGSQRPLQPRRLRWAAHRRPLARWQGHLPLLEGDGLEPEGADREDHVSKNKVKMTRAFLKAHGKISGVSAVSVFRLHGDHLLLSFANDNGKPMAGGLIIKPRELYAIARAARNTRKERTGEARTVFLRKQVAP